MVLQEGYALTYDRWKQQVVGQNIRLEYGISAVSLSCLSNSRKTAQPYRCRVSGATGANDCTPTPHGWNRNSHSDSKTMEYIQEILTVLG